MECIERCGQEQEMRVWSGARCDITYHHSFLSHVHEDEEGGGGDEEVEGISWMVCQGGDDGGGGEMWVWLREQCLEGQCCTLFVTTVLLLDQ